MGRVSPSEPSEGELTRYHVSIDWEICIDGSERAIHSILVTLYNIEDVLSTNIRGVVLKPPRTGGYPEPHIEIRGFPDVLGNTSWGFQIRDEEPEILIQFDALPDFVRDEPKIEVAVVLTQTGCVTRRRSLRMYEPNLYWSSTQVSSARLCIRIPKLKWWQRAGLWVSKLGTEGTKHDRVTFLSDPAANLAGINVDPHAGTIEYLGRSMVPLGWIIYDSISLREVVTKLLWTVGIAIIVPSVVELLIRTHPW